MKICGFKCCGICYDSFKEFKRNCKCKSDQYICLKCIEKIISVIIETARKEGKKDPLKKPKCPFGCNSEIMKNIECPNCNYNNNNNESKNPKCNWCKKNKDIQDMYNNFFIKEKNHYFLIN